MFKEFSFRLRNKFLYFWGINQSSVMRKLLFVLFLIPTCLFAQSYTEAVDVPGKNAATLYKSAKEWYAENINVKGDLPLTEDNAAGKMLGKGSATFLVYSNDVAVNMIMTYALKLNVKEGQYTYEFYNIMIEHGRKFPYATFKSGSTIEGTKELYKTSGMKSPTKKMLEANVEYNTKVLNQVDIELKRLIESLSDKMKN